MSATCLEMSADLFQAP